MLEDRDGEEIVFGFKLCLWGRAGAVVAVRALGNGIDGEDGMW